MRRLIVISFLVLLISEAMAQYQYKRRNDLPISIGISEVFSYHIQNINLGVDIGPGIGVGDNIVVDGKLVDPDGNYKIVDGKKLQYREFSKGMDFTLGVPFVGHSGIGVGVQYTFDARDRMRYYMRFYYTLMDWDQKFHLSPVLKLGIRQTYTNDQPKDNFFAGADLEFDVRICSRLFFFLSASFDYSRNSHFYQVKAGHNGSTITFDSEEKHDNFIWGGSYGLKFKMWRN